MTGNPNIGFLYHGLVYLILFMASWRAYKTESLKFFSEKGWAKNIIIHFFLLALGILSWGMIPIFLSGQTSSLLLIFGKSLPTGIQLMLVGALAVVAFVVTRTQSKSWI